MGWFEEQIKQRKISDEEIFRDSLYSVADAVIGSKISSTLKDNRIIATNAIQDILKYYHINEKMESEDSKKDDINDILETLLRPYNIMRRRVELDSGWYKNATGPMLGTLKEDNTVIALIPDKINGYRYYDYKLGKYVKINSKTEKLIDKEAIIFYKTFPLKKIGISDLIKFIFDNLKISDFVMFMILTGIVTAVGMLLPWLTHMLYSSVIKSQNIQALVSIGIFMIAVTISSTLFEVIKSLIFTRVSSKLDLMVESATMIRVLSLPANFFREYNSGELANRIGYVNSVINKILDIGVSTTLTSVFSLAYFAQVFQYAPALVVPSLLVTFVTVIISVVASLLNLRLSKKKMECAAKENGICYSLISGIQKIKLSGAEKRAFSRWAKEYADDVELEYNPPLFLKLNNVIIKMITLFGNILVYFFAVQSQVGVAEYNAFNAAFGMISGAFTSLVASAMSVAQIKPILQMAKPILNTQPEISENKKVIKNISGSIELNNVSFRYKENTPYILNNLSLNIRAGQYVAIVGRTGCGKSTLMRLLLGFEKPNKGAIYYNGNDIENIDTKSLRSKIGSVMQNGKLMSGSIYENIVLTKPTLTLKEAWEAAEIAGIADDIRAMPMQMHTIISEGQGGVSGGQKQRILIARAVAPKPKILIFDEATSALDNITQKKVSEALDALKCTRIVIAHRLSTIRECDRIIVLDDGKIVEDGNYEELIERDGVFAELVKRQMVEAV